MLRCALAAVPMACAVLLSSCYGDEADGCPPDAGSAVPVKVNVSAGEIGDLNASRAGGDANAEDGEFINTLYVYIVKEERGTTGTVLRVHENLSPDLIRDPLAQDGNLTDWTSETFTLEPGKYTFYAFANIDNYSGEYGGAEGSPTQKTGKDLLDDCFGATSGQEHPQFRNGDLADFRLYDPASEVNIEAGKYIPMSAVASITVSGDLNASGGIIVDLPLERLVSKVRMTVGDGATLSSNASVTFSGCSQNVPLMAASTDISRGSRDASATKDFENGSRQIEFYVNETPTGEPFTVTLNTGKTGTSGISTYEAKTKRTDIPRNNIYPLSLSFPDFDFNLTPTAWLYVTGVSYAVYYNVGINNVLTVEIATGSYFNFAPGNMSDSGGEYQTTWSWTVPKQQNEGLNISLNQDGEIEGNVPAGNEYMGYKYTLYLNGKWTNNDGNSFDRTYTVIVDVCHDEAWAIANRIQGGTTTRGTKAEAPVQMLAPENLNMFKMK